MDPRFYAFLFDFSGALGLCFLTVMLFRAALSTGRVPIWALLVSSLLALWPPFALKYLVTVDGRYLSSGMWDIALSVPSLVAIVFLVQSGHSKAEGWWRARQGNEIGEVVEGEVVDPAKRPAKRSRP